MYYKSLCSVKFSLAAVLRGEAQASAEITGSEAFPGISGTVYFYQTNNGTVVYAEITGLPRETNECGSRIFGFHIHEGGSCSGDAADPFSAVGQHYDPNGCGHPHHAGDMPPLFGNNGTAVSAFLTNRFSVDEVIGRAVIIHDSPDDFTTQPSGNAGVKIACGIIH